MGVKLTPEGDIERGGVGVKLTPEGDIYRGGEGEGG